MGDPKIVEFLRIGNYWLCGLLYAGEQHDSVQQLLERALVGEETDNFDLLVPTQVCVFYATSYIQRLNIYD